MYEKYHIIMQNVNILRTYLNTFMGLSIMIFIVVALNIVCDHMNATF
jgi:hypothetical protein